MLTITNNKGRQFNIRIVPQGEKYGRNDCVTNNDTDPIVAFYDATYIQPEHGWRHGQPCSSYFATTLLSDGDEIARRGLCLHGGIKEWDIDGKAMAVVIDYIKKETRDDRD